MTNEPAAVERFVRNWEADWNSRDIDRILTHYAEDVVWESPQIRTLGFNTNPLLRGNKAVRLYLERALDLAADPHLNVIGWTAGPCAVAIHCQQDGIRVIHLIEFDESGRGRRVFCHHATCITE